MRILVVDDEKLLVKGVKFNLENEGYEVECAYDGASAVELARNGRFDLIILDVMMPELDGQEACMRIREFSNVPIIMLTAKSEDADKLMGFECGADDYVTKPFNILELKARVRALLRRAAGTQRNRGAVLTAGDLSLNTEERVAIRDGKTVDLTAKEYDLIELLMRNPRRVYSRENLMNVVWGYAYAGDYDRRPRTDLCPSARNDAACRADLTAYFRIQIGFPRRYIRMMPQINLIIRVDFFYQQRQFEKVSGSMISSNIQLRCILLQRLYSARNCLSFHTLYIHFDGGNALAA